MDDLFLLGTCVMRHCPEHVMGAGSQSLELMLRMGTEGVLVQHRDACQACPRPLPPEPSTRNALTPEPGARNPECGTRNPER